MRTTSNFAVAPDGQSFVATIAGAGLVDAAGTPSGSRLHVILNWFEQLKERVPTTR